MGSRELPIGDMRSAALAWARTHIRFDSVETVTDSPWSMTYRLMQQGTAHYLKLVPPQQAANLSFTQRLAAHLDGQVPRVLAVEPSRGWMLSADHGARSLDYEAEPEDLLAVIRSYARLQARAAARPELWHGARHSELGDLVSQLIGFLEPASAGAAGKDITHAEQFLGARSAAEHLRLVQHHRARLEAHIREAAALPTTINHGDLRPPNAAVAVDGTGVLLDWDDAVLGPAGMSLHGLFGGCVVPSILLTDSPTAKAAADTPKGQMMRAYLDTLVGLGYASEPDLRRALPASMCAGLIQFILTFARYPAARGHGGVRDTMNRRLGDLVDLCDWLSAKDPQDALDLARTYESMGAVESAVERARNLYRDQVARQPQRADLIADMARTCLRLQDFEQARECYEEALRLTPDIPELHVGIAATHSAELAFDLAQQALQGALSIDPQHASACAALRQLHQLMRTREEAALPDRMPMLDFGGNSDMPPNIAPEQIGLGVELFNTYGTLQINQAFSPELIARLQQAFFERYAAYFEEGDHPDALRLGDRRYMLTVDMKAPFDDLELFGAETVMPIIRRLLGDDCVLGAFTAVISLPGSKDQKLHKDHPSLFPNTPWQFTAPCFAAQLVIPLVPLDHMTGTTRFFKGSHRLRTEEARALAHQDPQVELGSCLLMDYRCAHHGLGNQSDRVRPILTLIFNRPWFRDYRNYGKQPPLRFDDARFGQWPDGLRAMVDWWREERSVAARANAALGIGS